MFLDLFSAVVGGVVGGLVGFMTCILISVSNGMSEENNE